MASRGAEGLVSEDLRVALTEALAGKGKRLADLLSRHGNLPGPRPNLNLAAAFGAEVARLDVRARPVVAALGEEDAAPDTARVFLPIAAAYAWVARLEVDHDVAWNALAQLLADERAPVRLGAIAAVVAWAARDEKHLPILIARATAWLGEHEDRDLRWNCAATVLDVIADKQAIHQGGTGSGAGAYVEAVITEIIDAPRAAERTDGRRRLLAGLPAAIAQVANSVRAPDGGMEWMRALCAEARNQDLRPSIEQAIERLRKGSQAQSQQVLATLQEALASSKKIPRDIARQREGTGRGKRGGKKSR